MLRSTLLGFATLLLMTGGVLAQGAHDPIQTGDDLYGACGVSAAIAEHEDPNSFERAQRQRCRNYLAGFVQASVATRTETNLISPYSPTGEELFCYRLPDEMSWAEMEQLVVAHGDANPDALTMYAADFLVEVLVANYPCEDPAAPTDN